MKPVIHHRFIIFFIS